MEFNEVGNGGEFIVGVVEPSDVLDDLHLDSGHCLRRGVLLLITFEELGQRVVKGLSNVGLPGVWKALWTNFWPTTRSESLIDEVWSGFSLPKSPHWSREVYTRRALRQFGSATLLPLLSARGRG